MPYLGRPQVLDEVKQWEVRALISAGCSIAHAAEYVGCSTCTIRRHAERDEAFRERLRRSEVSIRLSALETIRKAATTHWRAAAWLIDRTGSGKHSPSDSTSESRNQIDDVLADIAEQHSLPALTHD